MVQHGWRGLDFSITLSRSSLGSGPIIFPTSGLVKKNRMPRHISKWFLFLFSSWKQEGIFFWYCQKTWKWNSQKWGGVPPMTVSPDFFFFLTPRVFYIEPLAISQSQFMLSCTGTISCRGFCLWVSALVIYNSLYSPVSLSNYWGSCLPYDLISLTDLRGVVDFQFVRLLLVGRTKCCQDKV